MLDLHVLAGGIRLHVQDYPHTGEPVLFVGWSGSNAAVWNGVVPHFLAEHRVIVVEPRGHGQSDKPAVGYTRAIMADEVLAVMDALGVEKAHLVGSSLGAEVLSMLAGLHPERVLTLVCEGAYQNCFGLHGIYDTPSGEVPAKLAELRESRKRRDDARVWEFDSREAAVAYQRENWQQGGVWNPIVAALVEANVVATQDGAFAIACPRYVIDQYMEDYWQARFDETFARVTCPVLFLPSSEDAANPVTQRSIAWLRGLLQVSRVIEIPGAQHALCTMLQPDEFAGAVRSFHKEFSGT